MSHQIPYKFSLLAVAHFSLISQAPSTVKDVETLYRISYVKVASLSAKQAEDLRKLEVSPVALRDALIDLNKAFAAKQKKEIDQRERPAYLAEIQAKTHPERSDLQLKYQDERAKAMNSSEGFVIEMQVAETSMKALKKWQPGMKAEQLLRPGELDFIDPPVKRSYRISK